MLAGANTFPEKSDNLMFKKYQKASKTSNGKNFTSRI